MSRMPRFIKLFVLSIRDLLTSIGPSLLVAAALIGVAYFSLDPLPPGQLKLATGPPSSAYANFGVLYKKALNAKGLTVELVPTGGPLDNLRLLREGQVDFGFVRGGLLDPVAEAETGELLSLGSLFYEPIWIFYRSASVAPKRDKGASGFTRPAQVKPNHDPAPDPAPQLRLSSIAQLRGLRVNVNLPGSGVPALMSKLFEANLIDPSQLTLSQMESADAVDRLLAGELDAVVMISARHSTLVQRLLRSPGIGLLEFPQAEAYARLFPFVSPVTLPRGIVELADDLPPRDVPLLATTTSLLTRNDTHAALRQLLADEAQTLHGGAGWFNRMRDFPNTKTSMLKVAPEGDRAINGTPQLWSDHLPYWASSFMQRMWLIIGGLLVLLVPLSRLIPPLYTFQVRRRVFRWYARLREIESNVAQGKGTPKQWLGELEELNHLVHGVTVPLSHADELYTLRANIDNERRRILERDNVA